MWNKFKEFLGLDEILADEPLTSLNGKSKFDLQTGWLEMNSDEQGNNNLVNVRTLQIELRKCKEEIRQKNDLLNELSTENIKLAQGLKSCSEIIYEQEKLINVFQDIYNNGGK
nr:MAG TPA: hypothetical protein [Caudoviricetes sp.]